MRLLVLFLVLYSNFCYGQDFSALIKKADSLYHAGRFREAGIEYTLLAKSTANQPGQFFRANSSAARAWTRSNIPDSAFSALNRIVSHRQLGFHHLMNLTTDPQLRPLHADRRWGEVITKMFHSTTAETNAPVNSSYQQEEIIYGRKDGMALTMLRLRPVKVSANGSSIIHIRSGGWGSNFYLSSVAEAQPFVDEGYHVFIVFHGSEPVYTVPDAIDDLQRAVRFIRYNAKGYGLDPDKICALGNSAGGHLALMLTLADSSNTEASPDPVDRMSSKVRAAVSYYPVSNFLEWNDQGHSADSAFLFKEALPHVLEFRQWDTRRRRFNYVTHPAERKSILKQISPIYHVSDGDGAVLLFHGDKDELVPVQQSKLLAAKLKEKNVSITFKIKEGADHGWQKSPDESALVMRWIQENLR